VPAARVEPTGSLDLIPAANTFGTAMLTEGLTTVRTTGDRAYAGELDLTKSNGSGPAGVPFTARTDERNRLIELIAEIPGATGTPNTVSLRYSGFGEPVDAVRPAGEIKEAPAGHPGTTLG
jgi:hypothetical protein